MTRRYTDQLIQELPNELPDNTTGAITPATLRQMITDVVQSLRPALAGIAGDHMAAPKLLTLNNATWTPILTSGLFTGGAGSSPEELDFNLTNGSLVVKLAGYNHFVSSVLSFEGPNGRLLDLAIGVNGVPVGLVGAVECLGNNVLQQFTQRIYTDPPQNSQIQLLGKWYTGAATDTLKISGIQLIGELVTTRYP
jgi:hypothetical protein